MKRSESFMAPRSVHKCNCTIEILCSLNKDLLSPKFKYSSLRFLSFLFAFPFLFYVVAFVNIFSSIFHGVCRTSFAPFQGPLLIKSIREQVPYFKIVPNASPILVEKVIALIFITRVWEETYS